MAEDEDRADKTPPRVVSPGKPMQDSPLEKKSEPKPESDEDRSRRHGEELAGHLSSHKEQVAKAHADSPTPRGVRFGRMTRQQKLNTNAKRRRIDDLNRKYFLAVRATCERHRSEDSRLQTNTKEFAR